MYKLFTKGLSRFFRPFRKFLLIMKLASVIMILGILQVSAASNAQKLSLKKPKASLEEVFEQVRVQTGYKILCNADLIKSAPSKDVNFKNADINQILQAYYPGKDFAVTLKNKTIVIKRIPDLGSGQLKEDKVLLKPVELTGVVTDSTTGEPLVGVTVQIKGSTTGTTTDAEGKFRLSVPDDAVLMVSYVGYKKKEVVVDGKEKLVIHLGAKTNVLNEIVAIGYGSSKKSEVTGAVSSIRGDDISDITVSSAAEAIEGKIPGVRVVKSDGEPGSDIKIRIRGGTSITQDNSPLVIVDGSVSDIGLNGLDPTEIESIDVLKDAAAASIYGARGANGVILVTTRKGKKGRPSVSYNFYTGFNELTKYVGVLNTLDFVKLQYELAMRSGSESVIDAFTDNYGDYSDFESLYGEKGKLGGINWQNIMFGDHGVFQSHKVAISGGGDNNTYRASYSHNKDVGILSNTSNVKDIFQFKFSQEVTKKLKMDIKTYFTQNKKNGAITSGRTLQNSLIYRPVSGIKYTNEELLDAIEDPIDNSLRNPKVEHEAQTREYTYRSLNLTAGLNYQILPDLSLKVFGSGTWRIRRWDSFNDAISSSSVTRGGANGSVRYAQSLRLQNTNTLNYNKRFRKNTIRILLGNETITSKSRSLKAKNYEFPDDNFSFYDLSLGNRPSNPSTSFGKDGLVSFFGRLFYNYDSRYLLTFTMRSDGSSKFAKENRFGYFPSISVAWGADKEAFFDKQTIFSSFKLRFSYGQAGNDRIGSNRYSTIFESTWYTNGANELPALRPAALANPNLQWETSISKDIGFDFGLLKDRITGTIDLYNNKSKDLLLSSAIPAFSGFTSQIRNIGSFRHKGLELSLHTVNIKKEHFVWTTDFNISWPGNEVLALTRKIHRPSRINGYKVLFLSVLNPKKHFIKTPIYEEQKYSVLSREKRNFGRFFCRRY